MHYSGRIEYASERKIRARNKGYYRVAHWPIWIWVFFLTPGPLTFNLFAHGFSRWNTAWLLTVLLGTGLAGWYQQLPGVEAQPYILRFDEDKPNPLYRKVCYTFAWNAVINFALMNMAGLVFATLTGTWRLQQIYWYAYSPVCAVVLMLGLMGKLPRAGQSTKNEGMERRYFYGAIWSATAAQTVLLVLWKALPNTREGSGVKLAVYVFMLLLMGALSVRGILPRTRPILPGELMVG